jgi:hypothetical protein
MKAESSAKSETTMVDQLGLERVGQWASLKEALLAATKEYETVVAMDVV